MKKKQALKHHVMYHLIHKRLSLIFTLIAGLILIIMSVSYLSMSEKELKNNDWLSFSSESNTILANFKEQTTITTSWLTGISTNKNFFLAVYDNGIPFSYNATHLTSEQQALAGEVLSDTILEKGTLDGLQDYEHTEFTYTSASGNSYYTNTARIGSKSTPLYVIILSSNELLSAQLSRQRIFFILIDVLGILLLLLFSWYYTGRLLSPILEAQEKQNQFIAAASHELRTPLSVILSCVHAKKQASEAERERLWSVIDTEGNRMSTLVNDLLTLARADGHNWNISFSDVELDTLLLNSYESFLPLAHRAGISLEINLPKVVPPPCHCDKDRISQVLAILISNAISYGKKDGFIRLSLSVKKSDFIISVADNGIGISAEAKKHIFDRFYREDSSRSQKNHFGLGLSIAREIALAHHGSLSVTDTTGGGSTFTLKLPVH